MNITDRIKGSTAAEEAVHAALKKSISELQETARDLARLIDTKRLAQRPSYPTFEQCKGIIEAVRRFKAGEPGTSHLGDGAGPPEEPYAVRYSPQAGLGWMHIASGAPFAFDSGRFLWHYTDEEIEFLIAYVQDQGVEVDTHWRADGGLSLRFRAKEQA